MSNEPYQTKRPANQQKSQPEKNTKQNEADKKLERSKIASAISSRPERNRAQGKD